MCCCMVASSSGLPEERERAQPGLDDDEVGRERREASKAAA